MIRWTSRVSRVSVMMTVSAVHSATFEQWARSDVTLLTATRSGPGCGCTSPHSPWLNPLPPNPEAG